MKPLQEIWQVFSVVVDIAIVSYVFYKLLMLIRGTRAIQLIQGIVIIVLAWVLSSLLNLRTLEWLMSQAFTYGVLVILIIFQPEFRRALEQLGRGRFFVRTGVQEDSDLLSVAEACYKAATYMAQRRIGALIVLERKIGLNDMIETGTRLEAKLSAELLINIFTPNTPLHDGAVIIRDATIMAAGCYLPLSESPFISKELGTRHRAAVGVSEITDCLSLVVSEETGQISLASDGVLERDIQGEVLFLRLREALMPSAKKAGSFRQKWGQKADG
ncbi:MAG: TIGR00159 family protein [Bacillus thermozeamaize]|uniref:Diadenylate cyclase n=1 Tax=Bacillus thermozeamaize TaxID=230954 RepID=A0A1Y3PKY7_9BACI|nr:MAG: TIGR00159 family protein [Bacillus thermozeamaize]